MNQVLCIFYMQKKKSVCASVSWCLLCKPRIRWWMDVWRSAPFKPHTHTPKLANKCSNNNGKKCFFLLHISCILFFFFFVNFQKAMISLDDWCVCVCLCVCILNWKAIISTNLISCKLDSIHTWIKWWLNWLSSSSWSWPSTIWITYYYDYNHHI